MKASEFIKKLQEQIETHGDLEMVILAGEMNDPEFVGSIEPKNANINVHGRHRWVDFPWGSETTITNSKVFLLEREW